MSYYRTFLTGTTMSTRTSPATLPVPGSIEGVLGYNNAIQLTQPMHLQDLKYFRDPLYATATGSPRARRQSAPRSPATRAPANWKNTYEQYIAREAWNAYQVHGGDRADRRNFARYAECDIRGQLAKYDRQHNPLIAYANGALTGNDADAVALHVYTRRRRTGPRPRSGTPARSRRGGVHGCSADAKAAEIDTIAEDIRTRS